MDLQVHVCTCACVPKCDVYVSVCVLVCLLSVVGNISLISGTLFNLYSVVCLYFRGDAAGFFCVCFCFL